MRNGAALGKTCLQVEAWLVRAVREFNGFQPQRAQRFSGTDTLRRTASADFFRLRPRTALLDLQTSTGFTKQSGSSHKERILRCDTVLVIPMGPVD